MSVDYQGINTYLEPKDHNYEIPLASGRSAYDHISLEFYKDTPDIGLLSKKDLEDLIVRMFKDRDVRGSGDRRMFRHMFSHMYAKYPALMITLLDLIPEYGYWKDFFYLALTNYGLLPPAMAIAHNQLMADERALEEGRPLSLFAKWIPKEGKAGSRFAKEFANSIYSNSDMSHSQRMAALRRRVSRLNAALNTVEVLECANRWDEIDPSKVPRIAMKKSHAAFMNETTRRVSYEIKIRHPEDEKRLLCRSRFKNFKPAANPHRMDESRYDPIRERVIAGLKGLQYL